jgi:TonB family protein
MKKGSNHSADADEVQASQQEARLRNSANVSAVETTRFWARLFLGFCLSILLHLLTSIATWKWADYASQFQQTPNKVLVEWIEPSQLEADKWKSAENQVVRKTEILPQNLALDRQDLRRRFLSQDRQTVKEEMQAARSGLTQNRSGEDSAEQAKEPMKPQAVSAGKNSENERLAAGKSAANPNHQERDPRRKLPELDSPANGLPVSRFSRREMGQKTDENSTVKRELLLPADPRRLNGVSTSGERLPEDVRIGSFTALNTDRFVYYTFYARIEEQIRHRWVRYVKAAMYGGGDVAPGKREFLTNLEIVLNRQGEFVRALVHQSSGSRDLDAAPVLAFREARMIPNPPREMLKPDGTIRLLYSFSVDNVPMVARSAKGAKSTESEEE